MSAGQGSRPLPWHRASFPADLFPQSQPHRAALEVRQKTVPLFDLLQRLRRLQTGHLRLPCSNQHRPQGHSRFPPHPPFPDILKITDREEVKYSVPADIDAYDAKPHLPELLERVARGEQFTITKHGRPVARLVPIERT